MEFKGALANIDLNQLPDEALGRIADGENPYAVLVSMLDRGNLPEITREPVARSSLTCQGAPESLGNSTKKGSPRSEAGAGTLQRSAR